MRQRTPSSIPLFSGVLAPILSLDALTAGRDDEGGPSFDIRDDASRVDDLLEHAQATAAVTDFVDSLPIRDQEIVKRLFWQNETQTQIAASFGISKMAISKAMARIARRGQTELADHRHLALNN